MFTKGRHGFHSNITYNDSHSQSAFMKTVLKVLLTTKHVKECVFESENLTYVLMPVGIGGEREPRQNVKGLQDDIACVIPSSLSQWESSSEDGTSSRFEAVKNERPSIIAVCHLALPCISQLSPGSLSSLACLLCAFRGNSCPQLTWCWGDMWDGHTDRQKTSKGQIMSNASRKPACALAQKLSGQLHKGEVNSEGHYLVQVPMDFDRMQMVSSSFCRTVWWPKTHSGPRRPCIAWDLRL